MYDKRSAVGYSSHHPSFVSCVQACYQCSGTVTPMAAITHSNLAAVLVAQASVALTSGTGAGAGAAATATAAVEALLSEAEKHLKRAVPIAWNCNHGQLPELESDLGNVSGALAQVQKVNKAAGPTVGGAPREGSGPVGPASSEPLLLPRVRVRPLFVLCSRPFVDCCNCEENACLVVKQQQRQ